METNIEEYSEEMPVKIEIYKSEWVIKAYNEAGFNCTMVNLLQVLKFTKENIPELFNQI